jgi:TRAP-type C4-dicarboxylate transport system permease large subunit
MGRVAESTTNMSVFKKMLNYSDIGMAGLVVLIVVMMIIPLPTWLLDVLLTLNITIALITPPMGACVYIVASVGNVSLEKMFRHIWPFVLVAMACLLALILVPSISLWLPRTLGY